METALWYLIPLFVVLLTSSCVGLACLLYGRPPGPAAAAPVSLLIVERLARSMRRQGGLLLTLGLVGVAVAIFQQLDAGASPFAVAAIGSTIVACIGLRGFALGGAVLALVERPARPVTAELQGRTVILRDGEHETHLAVSAWALARGRSHAVPASILRGPSALARRRA